MRLRKRQPQPAQLSAPTSGALRTFAYWLANGSVGVHLLEGIDYWSVMRQEPSLMEQAMAIFANNLRIDADGYVLNAREAEYRAAQYIHQYMTGVPADPPVTGDEVALHEAFGERLGKRRR